MDAPEAEEAYRLVKSQLDARQISLDEYNQRVAELQYLDNTGRWWAINPKDGAWLRWNGTAWEHGFESYTQSATMAQQVIPAEELSRSFISAPETGTIVQPASQIPSHGSRLPWSAGIWYAAGSIACGAASFFAFPYILGIAGILLGIAAIKEKYLAGAIGILISAAVIPVTYLTALPA